MRRPSHALHRPLTGLILCAAGHLTGCGADTSRDVAPVMERSIQRNAEPLFREMTGEVGLDYIHVTGHSGEYLFPEIATGGAAFFDYDRDGDLDIYFVNGNHRLSRAKEVSQGPRETNRLWRQEPDGRFVDVTKGSGLDDPGYGMGVGIGDINNDGYPDVYVSNYGPDRVFLNRGDGTFADVTDESGVDSARWGTSVCLLDFDRDGWLDLYVANYVDYFDSRRCRHARGQLDYCGPQVFVSAADKLYRNTTGDLATDQATAVRPVRFEDVSLSSGIARKTGPGLGVVSADFDGDQWPDLYVANDGAANFLWINQKDGTFSDEAVVRGCAYDSQGRAQAGMGVALGDLNHDQMPDLLVTHLAGEANALYLSTDSLYFTEASARAGLGIPSFPPTGFGTTLFDVEHDGDLDLAVANGRVKRPVDVSWGELDTRSYWSAYAELNQVFLNDGTSRFAELHSAKDAFTALRETSRALCTGDVDNDGDVDLLVVNLGGPARLYRNEARKQGHWLQVRAVLPAHGGRDAYNATITVTGGGRTWIRYANPASSYLASHDPRVHFGLGPVEQVEQILVRWPDGAEEQFEGGPVDRLVEVRQGEGQAR